MEAQYGASSFSRLPVADVLTLTSGNRLVKQPNGIITREVEVTHRLRRRGVVTGNDCIAIETNEVFFFWAHRLFRAVGVASEARPPLTLTEWRADLSGLVHCGVAENSLGLILS